MLIAARDATRKRRNGEETAELLLQTLAVLEAAIDRILDKQRALEARQNNLEQQTAATLAAIMRVRAL